MCLEIACYKSLYQMTVSQCVRIVHLVSSSASYLFERERDNTCTIEQTGLLVYSLYCSQLCPVSADSELVEAERSLKFVGV